MKTFTIVNKAYNILSVPKKIVTLVRSLFYYKMTINQETKEVFRRAPCGLPLVMFLVVQKLKQAHLKTILMTWAFFVDLLLTYTFEIFPS